MYSVAVCLPSAPVCEIIVVAGGGADVMGVIGVDVGMWWRGWRRGWPAGVGAAGDIVATVGLGTARP